MVSLAASIVFFFFSSLARWWVEQKKMRRSPPSFHQAEIGGRVRVPRQQRVGLERLCYHTAFEVVAGIDHQVGAAFVLAPKPCVAVIQMLKNHSGCCWLRSSPASSDQGKICAASLDSTSQKAISSPCLKFYSIVTNRPLDPR